MPQAVGKTRPSVRSDIERALALRGAGHFDEAQDICRAVLSANPGHADALHLLGLLRHQQGRNVEALELIGAALRAGARSADAHNNYGIVLGALRRHQEALGHFEEAIGLHAGHVGALSNRADTLARLERHEAALAFYEGVLALVPDHLHALNEAGALYRRFGQPEAALVCFARASAAAPQSAELHINKGTVLRALNRFDEALASFATALAIEPTRAEAHYNASLVRLCLGDFDAGWEGYEWRLRKADWAGKQRDFSVPLWLGDGVIGGKMVLLHAEQGLGDTIQFARYAPLLLERGARVVMEVQPPLKELLASVDARVTVIARGEPLPDFDLHCPLPSLPRAFRTLLATIPARVPYVRPRQDDLFRWHDRMPRNGRLRVGVCWAGSPSHLNDRNRSIRLDQLAAVLAVSGITFVSVQKDMSEADAERLGPLGVANLGRDLRDFADTAALIATLDLVISVDTSVAHLAGAMGKGVALLLPFSPDFRWLLHRTDSPWYPTMRLFRQDAVGDWTGPLTRLRDELAAAVRQRSSPPETTARG
jgi:tetratricopeptide (TPR) repeat protein